MSAAFQAVARCDGGKRVGHQDTDRLSTETVWRWQAADLLTIAQASPAGSALWLVLSSSGRHQNAVPPPPGISKAIPPVKPPPSECYVPSGHLLFKQGCDGATTDLVFVCDQLDPGPGGPIIVPVRSVYVIINTSQLMRGTTSIPCLDMSLELDADSWTWGFSARLPGAALELVEPSAMGEPVELTATINGQAYQVLVEEIARERTFGTSSLRVSGRGLSAVLDAPYAPIREFSSSVARTAQQLMADVLQINGMPIGWSVDWQLEDWLVPAGVWSHQGTHISALNAIAGAAGGYLQPHRSEQILRVLPRYPSVPWEWASRTPDFELPTALTTREAIEWRDLPRYNRVYVSGESAGVLAQVTRAGTYGDLQATTVVDPLITDAVAARQRGLAELGAGGRKAPHTLRLPVLPETGVIEPGKFVRYVEGDQSVVGLVRGTSVEVSHPETWQTLEVEVHVA